MDARPLSTSQMYCINGGIKVKGEDKAVEIVSRLFKPEEEIVEREIKRPLTRTPEEFAARDQEDTQGEKNKALSRYFIEKALLDKLGRKYDGLYMCSGCHKRKKLRLYKLNKDNDLSGESDYILLCDLCIKKRQKEQQEKQQEQRKSKRLWKRKYVKGDGSSKISFYNKIRKQVYKRDGYKCVFCKVLGEQKNHKILGLAPLIAESKGGERCFDNYVTCCASHRPAKSDKLPLNYIFEEISFKYYLSEQLDDEPVVKNPRARASVNMHLVAEIQQYLHRIAAGGEVDRSKAERLCIKLSESDDDRRREREQVLW